MWYLKCVNIPLSVLKDPKHGNGNNMGWLQYGFKTTQLSALALQFRDSNDDWVQYLPIHNKNAFDAQKATLYADFDALGVGSYEEIEDTDGTQYAAWKVLRDAYLNPPEA